MIFGRKTVDPKRPVKRINLGFGNLMPEEFATIDLFSDIEADERERDLARAVLAVKGKYGKNAARQGIKLYRRRHRTRTQRSGRRTSCLKSQQQPMRPPTTFLNA